MKKLIIACVAILGLTLSATAQDGLRVGIHTGAPLSDAKDVSTLNYGVDLSYRYLVKENLALGVATSYTIFTGEDFTGIDDVTGDHTKENVDNFSFLTVAASARGNFSSLFYTADIGYGFGMNTDDLKPALKLDDEFNGGLYYQGKFGWTNNRFDVYAFYKGISGNDVRLSSIGAGVAVRI